MPPSYGEAFPLGLPLDSQKDTADAARATGSLGRARDWAVPKEAMGTATQLRRVKGHFDPTVVS